MCTALRWTRKQILKMWGFIRTSRDLNRPCISVLVEQNTPIQPHVCVKEGEKGASSSYFEPSNGNMNIPKHLDYVHVEQCLRETSSMTQRRVRVAVGRAWLKCNIRLLQTANK